MIFPPTWPRDNLEAPLILPKVGFSFGNGLGLASILLPSYLYHPYLHLLQIPLSTSHEWLVEVSTAFVANDRGSERRNIVNPPRTSIRAVEGLYTFDLGSCWDGVRVHSTGLTTSVTHPAQQQCPHPHPAQQCQLLLPSCTIDLPPHPA